MTGLVKTLCDVDRLTIPKDRLTVTVEEACVEEDLRLLSLRYAEESPAETVEAGDRVYCRSDAAAYPDGRTILLFGGVALPGAEEAVAAVRGKTVGDRVVTVLSGRRTELTVEKIVRRTPAPVTDALIAGLAIDGVSTVADYRSYRQEKRLADRRLERSKELTVYLLKQMEAGSEFVYDEAEMEQYVDACLKEYAEAFPEEMAGEEEGPLRESVRASVKQNWLAEAFCRSRGIEIDRAVAEEEADQMREMMSLAGEKTPDRDEMVEEALRNAYTTELFQYLDTIIAQKMEAAHGNG